MVALHYNACIALHYIVQVKSRSAPPTSGMTKADVQKKFKKQIYVFVSEKMDFLLCQVRIGTDNMLTVVRNI